MAKKTRLMRVDDEFSFYIDDLGRAMAENGKEMSKVELTKLVAKRDKRFFHAKKKRRDEDDFYDILGL